MPLPLKQEVGSTGGEGHHKAQLASTALSEPGVTENYRLGKGRNYPGSQNYTTKLFSFQFLYRVSTKAIVSEMAGGTTAACLPKENTY